MITSEELNALAAKAKPVFKQFYKKNKKKLEKMPDNYCSIYEHRPKACGNIRIPTGKSLCRFIT